MTHSKLISLPGMQQESEEEENVSFREKLTNIINEHQENLREMFRKWIVFRTEFGARKFFLDEFPLPLTRDDRDLIIDWLQENGIEVRVPRMFGRVLIEV